jgi:hypothetical protein
MASRESTDRNSDKYEVLKQTKLSSWPFAHGGKFKEGNTDLQEQEKSLKSHAVVRWLHR